MRRLLPLLLASGIATADEPTPVDQLWTMNCAACHQLDQSTVGPSMVEMRKLYNGKPKLFVQWCIEPQRKREGAVEMPSMRHIPEADLLRLHSYIIGEADGVREKGARKDVDLYPLQKKKTPFVQRIFVDRAGPASIFVAINDDYSYVWDAGPCRLRQIIKGSKLDGYPYFKGNGNAYAAKKGNVVLEEPESPLAPLMKDGDAPRFLGYSMKDGLPTFRYRIGEITVQERLTFTGGELVRHFDFEGAPANIVDLLDQDPQSNGTEKWPSAYGANIKPTSLTLTYTPPS